MNLGKSLENNIQSQSESKKPKYERKYYEFLISPLGAEISKRDNIRNSGLFKKEEQPEFSFDDFKYGAMAIHDYQIELTPSGDIAKDAEFLFKAINATKLLERLDNNENPFELLKELKKGMQDIIDNSNKSEFKDKLWKAIETKVVIEDIVASV
jgi:hypothetical protein